MTASGQYDILRVRRERGNSLNAQHAGVDPGAGTQLEIQYSAWKWQLVASGAVSVEPQPDMTREVAFARLLSLSEAARIVRREIQ